MSDFTPPTQLRVGQMLYGFCHGAFGRDSYSDQRVEAVGSDWVVARDENGVARFTNSDPNELLDCTDPELSTS